MKYGKVSNLSGYLKTLLCVYLCSCLFNQSALAQASFLIWPIYPVIEHNEKATPVWLENVGKDSAMVQVRVFKWTQSNGNNEYANQQEIIASPPIVKINAGTKQMIRLTKSNVPLADLQEHAYRIIIDELPFNPDANVESSQVNIKMRYSLPLFVYGQGLGSGKSEETIKLNAKHPNAKPILHWSIQTVNQKKILQVENTGLITARISGFKIDNQDYKSLTGDSTFGYVLPGQTFNFELNPNVEKLLNSNKTLDAIVGTDLPPIPIKKK